MANYTYSSLGTGGTVQASAADVSVSNHILSLTGAPPVDVRLIESAALVTSSAETLGVVTVTPTNSASSDFSLLVTQLINGVPKTLQLSVVTAASGSTATTICDAWRAQLLAAGSLVQITGSGSTTFVMTAKAGYPILSAKQISLSSSTGTLAIVQTTTGAAAVGTYTALTNQGITTSPALVSGQSYTQFVVVSRTPSSNDAGGNVSEGRSIHTACINKDATNYAALATRLGEIINAFPSGGSTYPDPEFLALG